MEKQGKSIINFGLQHHDFEACEGKGKIKNTAVGHNQGGGMGTHIVGPSEIDCDKCRGRGFTVTEAGNVLIEFIKKVKSKDLFP